MPTWTPFLLHAAWSLAPWRLALVPVAAGAAMLHAGRLIDRKALKQIMHRLLIGTRTPGELAPVAARFAARYIARHVTPATRARIAADRDAGYRIVVATAAHRFYAAPLLAMLGVDDLVATEAVLADGHITPRIVGENCYGRHKHAMIGRWMSDQGIDRASAHVRFYSDHLSDLPTFDWADEAYAVNPHAPLRRLAAMRGWTVLDWR